MEWLLNNIEWLLSGIAVVVPISIIGWFLSSRKNIQKQKGGKGSTNIQVGGDFKIDSSIEKKDD